MTEIERADEIVRGPRRRFMQNIAMIVALLLSLVAIGIVWHDAQVRADIAETSALSLAEQVQHACESQGSLDLDGRDLCREADDVVEGAPPAAGPAGIQGLQGIQGERGFTGAQGIQGRTGPPGETGPPGRPGKDGMDGRPGADGLDGEPGADGADGTDGKDGADGLPGKDGLDGAPGKDGLPGADGPQGPPGTARPGTYTCPEGQFTTGFTIADDGAVTLTCADLLTP